METGEGSAVDSTGHLNCFNAVANKNRYTADTDAEVQLLILVQCVRTICNRLVSFFDLIHDVAKDVGY